MEMSMFLSLSLQKTAKGEEEDDDDDDDEEEEAPEGLLKNVQLPLSTVRLMWEDNKILLSGRCCRRRHGASCL